MILWQRDTGHRVTRNLSGEKEMQLPEKYVNSMKELLADEFDSYMEGKALMKKDCTDSGLIQPRYPLKIL